MGNRATRSSGHTKEFFFAGSSYYYTPELGLSGGGGVAVTLAEVGRQVHHHDRQDTASVVMHY